MSNQEKLDLFKVKYEKDFDRALIDKNKARAREIIRAWIRESNQNEIRNTL